MRIAIKLLFSYIKKNKIRLFCLVTLLFILMVSIVSMPLLIGFIIDNMVAKNDVKYSATYGLLIAFTIFVISRGVSLLITNWLQEYIFCDFVKDIRKDIFIKILKIDNQVFEKYSKGDILSRIVNDVDSIANILRQGISSLIVGLFTIILTFIIICIFNIYLAIVLLICTPLGLFMTKYISKSSYKYFMKSAKLRGELYTFTEEVVDTLKERKNFETYNSERSRFDELLENLYNAGIMGQFFSSLPNPAMRFINAMIYLVVAMFCSYLVIINSISVGLMVAFLKYTNQYVEPFNDITQVITQFQGAIASLDRINKILLEKDEYDVACNNDYKLSGDIKLENISFSYTDKPFIEGLNLNIRSKSRVALVGRSGCGKTTLINIIMGMYDIKAGNIYFDNISYKDICKASLRENISFVLQDSFIMNTSVKENISYGRECSDEDVIKAAKKAYAHDFIMMLPNGYETILEENGNNLSQGEKQLICIARAMINTSPIIILDEATSDIDTRSETYIKKAFDNMFSDRTSIVVAHRLSTIKNSDLIIVMNNGKIIEMGNNEQLLKLKGEYYSLYKAYYE